MIRLANSGDRQAVIALMEEFHGASRASFPFKKVYASTWFKKILVDPQYLCLVLDKEGVAKGMFIAQVTPHPFGPIRMANEIAWWVSPGHRGPEALKMIAWYESWAKRLGCDLIGLTSLDSSVDLLYRRRGYQPFETHYLKVVSGA